MLLPVHPLSLSYGQIKLMSHKIEWFLNIFIIKSSTIQSLFIRLLFSAQQPGHYQTCIMSRTLRKTPYNSLYINVGYRSHFHYRNVINHVGSHWTGSWLCLTQGLDTVTKEISLLTPGNAPNSLVLPVLHSDYTALSFPASKGQDRKET
jgi:hypothetical protein